MLVWGQEGLALPMDKAPLSQPGSSIQASEDLEKKQAWSQAQGALWDGQQAHTQAQRVLPTSKAGLAPIRGKSRGEEKPS